MVVHLCVKFQDSSIILTSFRQGRGLGGNFTPKNELLKSPLRLGLKNIKPIAKFSPSEFSPIFSNFFHPEIYKAKSLSKDLAKIYKT